MAVERRAAAGWPHWPGRSEGTQRRERLERRLFAATDDGVVPEAQPASDSYVLFVSTPQGYALIEGTGGAPAARQVITLEDGDHLVARVGRSPLPGDERPCAFLERC